MLAEEGPRGGRVVACSDQAAAQGVHVNMPVAEAKSLAPGLAIAPYDPAGDRRALEKLAEACEQFSPCVALEEGAAPESLLMDISNLEHLWESEAKLAQHVERFFTHRGWQVRIAVAETVGMAWGCARFRLSDVKSLYKERMRTNGSPGLLVPLSPCLSSPLPIEALRIHSETASLLRQLGVETVAQLLALPREDLTSRFGEALLLRIDQWTGTVAEVLTPHRAPDPLVVRYEFEHATGDRDTLAHILSGLAEQLARHLAARDEGALQLICEIGCIGGESTPLSIGLFEPSASARQWMELLGLHLENARFTAEVARVTLRAGITGRLGARQGELFIDGWPRDPHQWALLVNRLGSRLGSEHVLRAELRESALPERAVRCMPAMNRRPGRDKETGRQGDKEKVRKKRSPGLPVSLSPCLSSPRPLLLYPQPNPLEVTCVAPNGPPQFIWLNQRRERITHHWGPERVETLWWRGPSVRRDYYRVALESGGHLWIFRRLENGQWFLHGLFS